MNYIDFSNRQNRDIRIEDLSKEYLDLIINAAKNDYSYPKFHIAPRHGLLNDPNGLCEIEGIYHIFYQWFPAGPVHGLKYWRHLTTKDFINYKDLGIGIAPDAEFDEDGCYTGITLQDDDAYRIYYTGIRGKDNRPSVCYGEIEENKVVNKRMLFDVDEKITTLNFRDPSVIKKDDKYLMLVGGEDNNNNGIITLYSSENPYDFKYIGNLKMPQYDYGYMLECPNYYEEDGKGILFFSPQGIQSTSKYDFRNVFSVVYSVGKPINVDTCNFEAPSFYEMDKGFDFYAPQSFKDSKGRVVLYGWLGNSKCIYPSDKNQWAHMLTIPRRVTIEGDRLLQWPLEELKELRQEKISICGEHEIKDCAFELEFEANCEFAFTLENDKDEKIVFSGTKEEYCLDRSKMSYMYNEKYGMQRYAQRIENNNNRIRVFVDNSSIEIFCDSGKTVFTSRFYIENVSKLKILGAIGNLYYLNGINISIT